MKTSAILLASLVALTAVALAPAASADTTCQALPTGDNACVTTGVDTSAPGVSVDVSVGGLNVCVVVNAAC